MLPDVKPCSTGLKAGWVTILDSTMASQTGWRGGHHSQLPLAGFSFSQPAMTRGFFSVLFSSLIKIDSSLCMFAFKQPGQLLGDTSSKIKYLYLTFITHTS